ncbi:LiaF transmembrane domain-containing protein [Microbacter margulisiae]|uniref:TM2 domain-containing membrane protein YozV n=1 Tax=Microbacter margulisiae TaxID=1350067 RepID=A0A7W5DS53_9PORP|nr:hypothetical protein [Microbacter margulisiae]MBB3188054.1 TM2 domain-containing membrane protein YozV [Microbacter margulisiae]
MKQDNRLSWAIILIFFGLLFLGEHLNIFPAFVRNFLFDFRNYPFYAGIIFLLTNKNHAIGIILLIIGILFRLSDIIRFTQNISEYIWPSLLIIAGVVLLIGAKHRKR